MEQGATGDKPGSEAMSRGYREGREDLAFTVASENCKPSLRNKPGAAHLGPGLAQSI